MQQLRAHLRGDTGRLAATYLAIIIGLTIVFSGVVYIISSSQFDRPLSSYGQSGGLSQFDQYARGSLQDMFDARARQARADLFASLVFLNVAVLLGGAFLSYLLARKTLEPIEAAMRSQTQFVSDASHELRTPLAALQITNEVALRKKKLNLADAKELISYSLAETIKLRDLSEALLGLARHGNADTSTSKVSLRQITSDVLQTLQPLAEQKRIVITSHVPQLVVTANQAAVAQILRAFIDNAIKYSPQNSTVSVVAAARPNGSGAVVSVRDDGPGIASEHHEQLFDRFYRVDESRSSQHVQGAGLGLAIAQRIAERHGYELDLASQLGKGATFSLHIP